MVSINHYNSERYGLDNMQNLLSKKFPETPAIVLEETDNIKAKTELLIQDLIDIAIHDGYIAKKENVIITTTKKMVDSFISEYNEAWKDKFITNEERSRLSQSWNMIYTETAKKAGRSFLLSSEEKKLLDHLSRKIKDLD
jgi:hypothetical protein